MTANHTVKRSCAKKPRNPLTFTLATVMRILITFLMLLLFSAPSFSDEIDIPDFNSDPDYYAYSTWLRTADGRKHRAIDEAYIGNKKTDSLTFWIHLFGPNYHMCYMSGEALQVTQTEYEYREGSCRLKLSFIGRILKINDENGQCKDNHCGSRAYLEGAKLFRVAE